MIQSGKGGGMGMLGGGGSNTAFGSSTIDIVEKATWYGAIFFFFLAVLAALAFANTGLNLPRNPEEKESMGLSDDAPSKTINIPAENKAGGVPSGN